MIMGFPCLQGPADAGERVGVVEEAGIKGIIRREKHGL